MLTRKLNRKAKVDNETGLGTNTSLSGGRFFNRDGNPNMAVKGMTLFERLNFYHALLTMPLWKFLIIVVLFFLGINLIFAGIYLWIGVEHLSGMVANSPIEKFGETFFFSAQTLTTVGYGRINPIGFVASLTASMEALTGLMSFAVITGLIYGRFARPKAFIRYSKQTIFAPFRNGVALMFRMVPYTKNYLVNVEVKGTLALRLQEDGQLKTRFYNIPFDISKANTMTSNWTLVHVINDESPFFGFTQEDLSNAMAEVLVYVQGFDETFSNTVVSRTSYSYTEFVYGAKFLPMYHPSDDNRSTVLHLDKLDDHESVELPEDNPFRK